MNIQGETQIYITANMYAQSMTQQVMTARCMHEIKVGKPERTKVNEIDDQEDMPVQEYELPIREDIIGRERARKT